MANSTNSPNDRSPSVPRVGVPLGLRALAAGHGVFYVVSGAWPLLSMASFEAVTGPKREDWLVRTMGGLIAVMGLGLIGGQGNPATVRPFALGSAAVLATADVIGVVSGRLRRIYLLDGLAEALLIGAWLVSTRYRSEGHPGR